MLPTLDGALDRIGFIRILGTYGSCKDLIGRIVRIGVDLELVRLAQDRIRRSIELLDRSERTLLDLGIVLRNSVSSCVRQEILLLEVDLTAILIAECTERQRSRPLDTGFSESV